MSSSPQVIALTEETFIKGISQLVDRDRDLARVKSMWGNPPFWTDTPGFSGLVHVILSQQVSLASADAAFVRLGEHVAPINPGSFLTLDDETLKEIGFSRQKAGYVRGLSNSILQREIDLDEIELLDDDIARGKLLKLKGIGPWTADIYLLMALRRSDVWPSGDLALAKAVQELMKLESLPNRKELDVIGERWKPWRSVAARILWHYYLSERQ
jgi:DNA-3-methyladenine glycosylase II